MARGKLVDITDKTRKHIRRLAGFGLRDDQIAVIVEISERTLQRRCLADLKAGRATAANVVTRSAFRQAISGHAPSMTMFWLKTQLGWKETDVHEIVGKDGGAIALEVSAVRERFARRIDRLASSPEIALLGSGDEKSA